MKKLPPFMEPKSSLPRSQEPGVPTTIQNKWQLPYVCWKLEGMIISVLQYNKYFVAATLGSV